MGNTTTQTTAAFDNFAGVFRADSDSYPTISPPDNVPASSNEEINTWKPGDLLRLQNTPNKNRVGETYELLFFNGSTEWAGNEYMYITARHIKTGEISERRRADRFVRV